MSKEDTIKCFLDCKGEDNGFQLTLTNEAIDVIANEIERLQDKLQQKENIIKEVREKINNYTTRMEVLNYQISDLTKKELLEILDKENK